MLKENFFIHTIELKKMQLSNRSKALQPTATPTSALELHLVSSSRLVSENRPGGGNVRSAPEPIHEKKEST